MQLFHDGDFVPKLALETVIAHVLALRHLCCRRSDATMIVSVYVWHNYEYKNILYGNLTVWNS